LVEVGRAHGIALPNTNKLRELVMVGGGEEFSFQNFLSKFQTLRLFYRSPEVIHRITRETIEDAARDNIRYMELRFTPVALSRAESFPLGEVMDWVIDATQKADQEFGVVTRLIASINRHEDFELAEEVVKLAAERCDHGIVGLDVAGNEAQYSAMGFLGLMKEAQETGLKITIHAGEWGGPNNILDAILYLGADRVGHGVRILEDPDITVLARERGIPFEVCVTSNYQSGVIPSLAVHPLPRMLSLGLNVTINTDDPSVSQITLGNEYKLISEDLGVSLTTIRERVIAAAQAAFLSEIEKQKLIAKIEDEFPKA
jgi:adenosine deaminase